MSTGVPDLDRNVVTYRPAELAQPLLESLDVFRRRRSRQSADSVHVAGLLSHGSEWPGEDPQEKYDREPSSESRHVRRNAFH